MTSDSKKGFGNVIVVEFTVVICTGCNATQFFSKPGKSNLLEVCKHEIIDVEPKGYR